MGCPFNRTNLELKQDSITVEFGGKALLIAPIWN